MDEEKENVSISALSKSKSLSPQLQQKQQRSKSEHTNNQNPNPIPDNPYHGLKPFRNQVGGHFPIMFHEGNIYKPSRDREIQFYSDVSETFSDLAPFLPVYLGNQSFEPSSFSAMHCVTKPPKELNGCKGDYKGSLPESVLNDPKRANSSGWSTFLIHTRYKTMQKELEDREMRRFLILKDVTYEFKKPCVFDIKLGIRHHPPFVTERKYLRQMKKSWKSTSRYLCARVGGMQLWNPKKGRYESLDKFVGKKINCNDFCNHLTRFLSNIDPSKPSAKPTLRKDLLERFLERITQLRDVFSQPTCYRFFSSSILLVYEGYRAHSYTSGTLTPPTQHPTSPERRSGTSVESGAPDKLSHTHSTVPVLHLDGTPNSQQVMTGRTSPSPPKIGSAAAAVALLQNQLSPDTSSFSAMPIPESSVSKSPPLKIHRRLSQDDGDLEVVSTPPLVPSTHMPSTHLPRMAIQKQASTSVDILSTDDTGIPNDQRRDGDQHSAPSDSDQDENENGDSDCECGTDEDRKSAFEEVTFEADEEEDFDEDDSESEFQRKDTRNAHSSTNAKNRYKYYDPRRTDVRLIDFSNLHPLPQFRPTYEQQVNDTCKSPDEGYVWLEDEFDQDSSPDYGILMGLTSLVKLLEELKETGSIRKRDEKEWTAFREQFHICDRAMQPFKHCVSRF